MIREVIIPKQQNINIQIPIEYVNKEVEFIMFVLDEHKTTVKKEPKKNSIESLGGVLHRYANLSKKSV